MGLLEIGDMGTWGFGGKSGGKDYLRWGEGPP